MSNYDESSWLKVPAAHGKPLDSGMMSRHGNVLLSRSQDETRMSKYFVERNESGHHTIFPGVDIYTMAGEEIMLSYVEFEPHAEVDEHRHPHEQLGMLLEGELAFTVGDERRVLKPGDTWRIPGGIRHRVVAGSSGARALDVFHPIREDYL